MRIPVAIALAVLLGLVFVGTLLVRGTELPWLGDMLAERIGAQLGRPVHLAKAPFIRVGSDLRIRLRGVSIDNEPWAGTQPLAELAEADILVETRSLFVDAPLHLQKVSIDGLRLRLVRDETGVSNLPKWVTDDTAAESRDKSSDSSVNGQRGLPFVLDELTVHDVRIERDNRELGTRQAFFIAALTQEGKGDELLIDARGTLQDQAWSFQGTHSGLDSLTTGHELRGTATARLADLSLDFDYHLAQFPFLKDLTLRAALKGTPPPRIAELSPLLSVDQPLSLQATVRDIDPGIGIDAVLDLGATALRISGTADDPVSGNGLDLSIDADVSSLSRFAQALNLGPAEDVTVTLDGHVRRRDRSLQVEDLLLIAGGHRIEGEVLLPLLPGTTDGRVSLTASGPDFGFYQRLLKRPFAIDAPYRARVELTDTGDGRESLRADVQLGLLELSASGRLGDFPSYRNTQLRVTGRTEDLSVIGRSFDLRLPATELEVQGDIDVTDAGRILITNTRIDAAEISATLDGGLDTYPELDDIELRLSARTPSLKSSSLRLGGPALGAVPVTLTAGIRGAATELVADNIVASAGASRIETLGGGLRLIKGVPQSDLRLAV
ncbi:MAG: AsmA family protein, partial [Halieaceae bacterium]|nr:AsmA family protein [Halieaceae bacterium]